MSSPKSNPSLEFQYIDKVLAIYNRPDDTILVPKIINSLSNAVTTTIHNNPKETINDNLFTDILDHVEDQSLREKHPRIMLILEDFIKAKTAEILNMKRDQTPNTKLAKKETIEDILNYIRKLKWLIEEHIGEIKYNKETITEMECTLDNTNFDIKTVRWIIDELNAEFESNVETIEEALKEFNNKKNTLIEKHKFKQKIITIKIPQDEIKKTRQIIDNIYVTLNDKLLSSDPTKTIHKKKLIDEYTEIMINMFEWDEKLVAIGTIEFMNNYITNIISSEKTNNEKREFLRHNLFKAIKTWYIGNREKAIRMLKLISIIKINELLKENEEDVHTISYVPWRIKTKVLLKLGEILKKFWSNKILNKKICNNFILNLDQVTPKLLQYIVEKKNINDFKVVYIIPILQKLEIPAEAHDDFMRILDLYYLNSRETIKELSIGEKNETISQSNNHLQAQAHLKNAFDKCKDKQELNTCNLVSQYVLNNIFWKISINIAAIIQDYKQNPPKSLEPIDITLRVQELNPSYKQPLHTTRPLSTNQKLNPSYKEQPLPINQTLVIDLDNPKIKSFCQDCTKEFLSPFVVPNKIKKDLELFIHYYYYYAIWILVQNKETGNSLYKKAENNLSKLNK